MADHTNIYIYNENTYVFTAPGCTSLRIFLFSRLNLVYSKFEVWFNAVRNTSNGCHLFISPGWQESPRGVFCFMFLTHAAQEKKKHRFDEAYAQKFKDDFQSVLRSLRTLMFINIINGSLDGMRIDVIR